MTCSSPAISAPRCGAPPVATRMCLARTVAAAAHEAHGVRVLDHRAALDDLDLRPFEVGGVGQFEPRDLAVLVGDQRRPVEARLRYRPAVACGILEFIGKARGIDEQLLRHAAADHARAADAVLLGDHDVCAIARRDARRAHAARTGTDDEKIDVLIRHLASCVRGRAGQMLWPFFFISARILLTTSSESLLAQACTSLMLFSRIFGSCSMSLRPTAVL